MNAPGIAVRPTSASGALARTPRLRVVSATDSASSAERSFDEFYAANVRGITVQIYAYFGNISDAQDVVQEAFCRAYPRWETLRGYDDPVAWVRRVAWNLATSKWRRMRTAMKFARKQREEHIPGPGPDHVALTDALRTLPDRQRRAVVLHYLADQSVAEIAEREGVAPGTVKSWLYRARNALAQQLTDTPRGEVNDA
ncbi:RNA polymerase sigma24 factor [Actinocatenispora thailandica]|uniref:RNA polymerase sigma24 factor n=1 Tax=Actinocatenispora thailandica TaxID=227318 RepID=A0A7R7DMT1_9ACTN|nr:RNA polymerase sigma24 factor [Actinocatenispora thailandica]